MSEKIVSEKQIHKIEFERKVNFKTMSMIPQKIIDKKLNSELWDMFLKRFQTNKKIKVTFEWED